MGVLTQTKYPRVAIYAVGPTPTSGPFAIPYTFKDDDEVSVFIDGVETSLFTIAHPSLYDITGNEVTLDSPVSDVTVSIYSQIGDTRDSNDVLTMTEISSEIDRIFGNLQELQERAIQLLPLDDAYDADNNRIENLIDPVNPQDAATRQYVLDVTGVSGDLAGLKNLARAPLTTGTQNDFAVTLEIVPTAYTTEMVFRATMHDSPTFGGITLDVNGLGQKAVKKMQWPGPVPTKVDIQSGDWIAGAIQDFFYDGTDIVLISPLRADTDSLGLIEQANPSEITARVGPDKFPDVDQVVQLINDTPGLSGDMAAATYDPATIAEQLVGLTAAQTITNKTLNADNNTITNIGSAAIKAEMVTGQAEEIAPAAGDFLLGVESGGAIRKFDVGNIGGGGGDMLVATYDPGGIAEQLVGLIAAQSLTNKTINADNNTITNLGSGSIKSELVSGQTEELTPGAGHMVLGIVGANLRKFDIGNFPTGGGGEINTGSNVGVGGVAVFKQKTTFDLEFRSIDAASTKILVALDGPNNEVTIDVAEGNLDVLNMVNAPAEAGATADQSDAEIETGYNNQVSIVTQVEAEAGTSTTVRRWTAERVKQSILALAPGGSGPTVTSGAGAPSSTPGAVGDIYIDTTAETSYNATGTASSADWKLNVDDESGTALTIAATALTDYVPWFNPAGAAFRRLWSDFITDLGIATLTAVETLTNKTISGASNTITNLGSGSIVAELVTGQTEEVAPAAGDVLLGVESGGALRKIDVGNLPTGGGGEANTASNVGVAGVAVFKQKTGINFEFKTVNAGSTKVTITDDTGQNEVDIDVVEANINALSLQNAPAEAGATADQTDGEIETAYNNQVIVVSQAEAEAGIATTVRRWTAQRVGQAIAALAGDMLASVYDAAGIVEQLVGLTATQTMTNKTLTDPRITHGYNAQVGTSYTLGLSDQSKLVSMNNAAANTATIPSNATAAIPVGAIVEITMLGAGPTSITAAAGVTLQGNGGSATAGTCTIQTRYNSARLAKIATDTWLVAGDINAVA